MARSRSRATRIRQEVDEVLRERQKKTAALKPVRNIELAWHPQSGRPPSQAEYERRELHEASRKLEEIQRAPLADRKAGQASFFEAMRSDPELVAERIRGLGAGNYGDGPRLLTKRILGSPRMNRSAAITQMIGALEWQSPEIMTRASWKELTTGEKARLERAVQGAITSALRED